MIHQQQQKVEHFLEKTDDNIKRKRHHQDGQHLAPLQKHLTKH